MSELGDLLERLHGARNGWRTVQATVHRWADEALTRQAWERHARTARRGSVVTARGRATEPPRPGLTLAAVQRVWIDEPGRRFRSEDGDRLRVHVGERWWHYDEANGAVSNESEPEVRSGGHGLGDLLDPAPLAGLADLMIGEAVDVGGRRGRAVTLTPRPFSDDRQFLGWAFHAPAATDFAWVVDDERGVLLRVETRFEGRAGQVIELHDLVFDAELADELFVFRAPDGQAPQPLAATMGRPEAVTLEEAAAQAPFTVLVPGRHPEGATIRVELVGPRARIPAAVWVRLETPDHLHHVHIHQTADEIEDGLDWEEAEEGWAVCQVFHQTIVKGERHGTHVRVSGDIDRATMIEIAASLRPAPTAPPRLVDAR